MSRNDAPRLAIGDRVVFADRAGEHPGFGIVIATQTGNGPEVKVEWGDGRARWYPAGMLARRRGRPPSTEPAGRSVSLSIRLHPLERAGVEAAAKAAGLSVADYVRGRLVTP